MGTSPFLGRRLRLESLERRTMLSATATFSSWPVPPALMGPAAPPRILGSSPLHASGISQSDVTTPISTTPSTTSNATPNTPIVSLNLATAFPTSNAVELQPASNVASSVVAPQVGSLLTGALQNVQTLGQIAGSVANDPQIASSLTLDLASLTSAINDVLNNVGNSAAAATLPVLINVTSSANPAAAALLNSLLTNVTDELQSIGTVAAGIGTSVSNTLASPLGASLSQIDNVVAGLDLLISGANDGLTADLPDLENNLAGNEVAALGQLNSEASVFDQVPTTVTTDLTTTAELLGSFLNSTALNTSLPQNVRSGISRRSRNALQSPVKSAAGAH